MKAFTKGFTALRLFMDIIRNESEWIWWRVVETEVAVGEGSAEMDVAYVLAATHRQNDVKGCTCKSNVS